MTVPAGVDGDLVGDADRPTHGELNDVGVFGRRVHRVGADEVGSGCSPGTCLLLCSMTSRLHWGSTKAPPATRRLVGDGRNDVDGRHAVMEEESICHSSM